MVVAFVGVVVAFNLLLAVGVRSAARGHARVGLFVIVVALVGLLLAAWLTAYSVGVLVLASSVGTTVVAAIAWGWPKGTTSHHGGR